MNPEIKAKWVEALRSGKYKQTRNALRKSDNRFCCLGVLCDIADPTGWQPAPGSYRHRHLQGMPDAEILRRADLPRICADELAAMNDGGKPFSEIASHIEANL